MGTTRRLRTMRGCGHGRRRRRHQLRRNRRHRRRHRHHNRSMGLTVHANALIALASAASWGGGDFSGGMGAKASGGRVAGTIRFVIVAHLMSLVALAGILWGMHAGMPLDHARGVVVGVGDCGWGGRCAGAGGVLYCAEPGRHGGSGSGERGCWRLRFRHWYPA